MSDEPDMVMDTYARAKALVLQGWTIADGDRLRFTHPQWIGCATHGPKLRLRQAEAVERAFQRAQNPAAALARMGDG